MKNRRRFNCVYLFILRTILAISLITQSVVIPLDAWANSPEKPDLITQQLSRQPNETLEKYLERMAVAQPDLFQQAAMIAVQDAFNGKLPETSGDQAIEEQIAHYLGQAATTTPLTGPDEHALHSETSSFIEGDIYNWHSDLSNSTGDAGSSWQLTAKPGGDINEFAKSFEGMISPDILPFGMPAQDPNLIQEQSIRPADAIFSTGPPSMGGSFYAPSSSANGNSLLGDPEHIDANSYRRSHPNPEPVSLNAYDQIGQPEFASVLQSSAPTLRGETARIQPIMAGPALVDSSLVGPSLADSVAEATQHATLSVADLSTASLAVNDVLARIRPTANRSTSNFVNRLEAAGQNMFETLRDESSRFTASALTTDLALEMVAPETASFNDIVTYRFTVRNDGPNPAEQIQLTHQLPASGAYIDTLANCDNSRGSVTCNIGHLAVGESASFDVDVQMLGNDAVVSSAQVTYGNATLAKNGRASALLENVALRSALNIAEQEVSASSMTIVNAPNRTQQVVGKIAVAANSFETVAGKVTATGAVQLGFTKGTTTTFHLRLGANDSISWSDGAEEINGDAELYQIKESNLLFSGAFTADGSQDDPKIVPSSSIMPTIEELGGFRVVGSAVITHVNVITGSAIVAAVIEFNQRGITNTNQSLVATINPGPEVEGTIDNFSMKLSGLDIDVSEATLADKAISFKQASLKLPAKLGGLTSTVPQMKITTNSVSLGGIGGRIPLPNIYPVGKSATTGVTTPQISAAAVVSGTRAITPTISILDITASVDLFNPGGSRATGKLQIWLPKNHQIIPVEFKINNGNIEGTVKKISLKIAGQDLTMQDVVLSNDSLKAKKAILTVIANVDKNKQKDVIAARLLRVSSHVTAEKKSTKKLSVIAKNVVIDGSGIRIGGAGITNYLPDYKIGSTATLSKLAFTIVVNDPLGDTSIGFDIRGKLNVHLKNNEQQTDFKAEMDDGKLSGELDELSLTIANSTLTMKAVKISGDGFSTDTATLTLPKVLNNAEAAINNVTVNSDGLSFGDANVKVPISVAIGKTNSKNQFNFQGDLTLELAQDRTYGFALSGTVIVKLASQVAKTTGELRLDGSGKVAGSIKSFKLTVAGMEVAVKTANINDSTITAKEATLSIPKEWGGLSASVYQIKITDDDFSIGGGKFKLPEMKVGDIALSLEGEVKPEGDGYVVAAGGLFKLPNLGAGGCSGLSVRVEIFATQTQQMRMVVRSMSPDDIEAYSLQLRQVKVGAECTIPIGSSGFMLTKVDGTLSLSQNTTKIEIKVTMESAFKVASFNALSGTGQMNVEYVKDPRKFEIGLASSMKVFSIFEAARSKATMRFTNGDVPFLFKAEMQINAVIAKGEAKLSAWTKDGRFHLVGNIYGEVGLRKGALVNKCVTIGLWTPCFSIPPFDLFIRAEMAFGEFRQGRDTVWGFKAEVNFLGKKYGVYVNEQGGFSIGNVSEYKTIDAPTLRRAFQLHQAVASGQVVQAALIPEDIELLRDFTFVDDEVYIDVTTITKPGDLGVALLRSQLDADVTVALVRPDGLIITGSNMPSNVTLKEDTVLPENIIDETTGETGVDVLIPQLVMNVTNAMPGLWRVMLNRQPSEDFMLYVDGSVYGPPVEGMSLTGQDTIDNKADVTWTQTTDITNTVTIYATQGAITTTASYTDTALVTGADGVQAAQVFTTDLGTVTKFDGVPVASFIYPPAGKQKYSEQIDLSSLRSGSYRMWIEVDDGMNLPTRKYFPGSATVWHEWNEAWQANLLVESGLGTVDVAWDPHPNPDAEGYEIEVLSAGDAAVQDTYYLDVGQAISQTVAGLTANQLYTVTIVAYNSAIGRISASESVAATPQNAPFTVAAVPNAITVNGGSSAMVDLTLTSDVTPYPDELFIGIDAPIEIDFELSTDVVTPTMAGTTVSLIMTPTASLPSGTYDVHVFALSNGEEKVVTIPINVQEPSFALQSSSSSVTLVEGGSTSIDIDATYQFGESDIIDIFVDDAPAALEWAFIQDSFAPGGKATLVLTGTEYFELGSYELLIAGIDDQNEQLMTLPLTVAGFDLFTEWDSWAAQPGETVEYGLSVDAIAWPDAVDVAIDVESLPDGITAQISVGGASATGPASTSSVVAVELAVSTDTPAGLYELLAVATSQGITKSLPLYLTVQEFANATDLQMGYLVNESADIVIAGEVYSYTLSPRNISGITGLNTSILEATFDNYYIALIDDGGCTMDEFDGETELFCDTGDIPAATEIEGPTISWAVDSNAPDGELIVHLSDILAEDATITETSTIDNIGEYVVEIVRLSDISLFMDAETPIAGTTMLITSTVQNNGPSAADNVFVDLYLPDGVSLDSAPVDCLQDGELVSCELGDMALGESTSVTLSLLVKPDFQELLEIIAITSSDSDDLDFENNVDGIFAYAQREASLAVAIVPEQFVASEGDTVDYLITIRNDGPSDANDVLFDVWMPESADITDLKIGGVTSTPDTLNIDSGDSLTATVSILFFEDSGDVPVLIEVEADAEEAPITIASDESLTVANSLPTAILSNTLPVGEGQWGILFVDMDDAGWFYDPLTVEWDLDNDGNFDDGSEAMVLFDARTIDGPTTQPIAVRVQDDDGGEVIVKSTVLIQNIAPIVEAGDDQYKTYGEEFVVDFSFVDSLASDGRSATIDWGDGTAETVTLPESGTGGQATHAYNQIGTFDVNICVADDDGGEQCDALIAQSACQEHGLIARFVSTVPQVQIEIENVSGSVSIPAQWPMTLYNGSTALQTFKLENALAAGESTMLTYSWSDAAPADYQLRLTTDDDGTGTKSSNFCSGTVMAPVVKGANTEESSGVYLPLIAVP